MPSAVAMLVDGIGGRPQVDQNKKSWAKAVGEAFHSLHWVREVKGAHLMAILWEGVAVMSLRAVGSRGLT